MTDEGLRLDELRRYDVFEGGADPGLDCLCELAARVCRAPMAVISFIDEREMRFLSQWGLPAPFGRAPIPVEQSFCQLTILGTETVVVPDALGDDHFAGLDIVTGAPHIRFYAGAPVVSPRGHAIATVCVLDVTPREMDAAGRTCIGLVRDAVMELLQTRREATELRRSEGLRQEAVEALLTTQTDLEARIALRTRELLDAHEKTRQILERIGDGFVAFDRNWSYAYVNKRGAELLGRTPEGLLGKSYFGEFPEARGSAFHLAYERAMREQVSITLEARYEPWDRWFENRIYPSSEGIAVFFTEITARVLAQRELESHRARLVEAQRVAHIGSFEWSVADNRVVWSDELYRIYGVPLGEPIAGYEGFLARVFPDDLPQTREIIRVAIETGSPFVYDHRVVRSDGQVRMLHTRGQAILEDGKVTRLAGSCWDVTERRQAQRASARTLALLEATLGVTSDGLIVFDADGAVVAFNQAFALLWRLPPELSPQDPHVLDLVAAQLVDGAGFLARLRALSPDEDCADTLPLRDGRVIEARSKPKRVDGEVAGRVCSFRDVPA